MINLKTTWVNSSSKDAIIFDLLNNHDEYALTEFKWTPFHSWLTQSLGEETPLYVDVYNFYKKLINKGENYPIYGKMFPYYSFSKQLISFAKEIFLYHVDIDSLPQETISEKELKSLLQLCLEENLYEKKLSKVVEKDIDLSNIVTTHPFLTNFFEFTLHQKLVDKGVEELNFYTSTPKKQSYRHALNPRIEIESIAQEIILDGIQAKDVLIICADTAYYEILEQVFNRYLIPHGFAHKSQLSRVAVAATAYMDCFIKKDISSLIHAFEQNCFSTTLNNSCLNYINQFITSLDDCLYPHYTVKDELNHEYLNRHEVEILIQEENEFNKFVETNSAIIKTIISLNNPKEICNTVFNHCVERFKDTQFFKEIFNVKSIIENLSPYLDDMNDLVYLVDCLSQCSITEESSVLGRVGITDCTHPLPPRKRCYVVGASQRNYPAFPSYGGIFDEAYRAKTTFPSMQERFDAYMLQLQWIQHSATEDLYYSYSVLDYQGKKSEGAYEIESQFTTIGELTCISNNNRIHERHSLDPKIASTLFFKDDILHGSVSSFERYFQCPYAYFIKSGLRVDEQSRTELAANTIGSIQHAILEEACKRYGKHYAKISTEEMIDIAKSQTAMLTTLLPKELLKINCILTKMIDNLKISFEFLEEMELNTTFEPTYFEYKFSSDYFENVHINGVIDRIDFASNLLRVIDYKSSSKSITETSFKAGLKLQLLTYLILAIQEFNNQPCGAYYYSLKNDNIDAPAAKISRGTLVEYTDEDYYEKFINSHRLSGWNFTETDLLDFDGRHCAGIRTSSKGMTFTIYDFTLIDDVLKQLYELLVDKLHQGIIPVDPVEGACTYCNYQTICRFKGEQRKEKPLVYAEKSLKKGSDTDEMES